MDIPQFLNSLSIKGAGELTFSLMVEEGFDTVDKINGMTILQIANIGKNQKKMIGEKTAEVIFNSLHSDRVQELLQYSSLWIRDEVPGGESLKYESSVNLNSSELLIDLRGKKVLFTGEGEFTRSTLTAILKRNGAEVKSSVTKDLDLLICADLESTSNKSKKARKYGIKMVTYKDVFGE